MGMLKAPVALLHYSDEQLAEFLSSLLPLILGNSVPDEPFGLLTFIII